MVSDDPFRGKLILKSFSIVVIRLILWTITVGAKRNRITFNCITAVRSVWIANLRGQKSKRETGIKINSYITYFDSTNPNLKSDGFCPKYKALKFVKILKNISGNENYEIKLSHYQYFDLTNPNLSLVWLYLNCWLLKSKSFVKFEDIFKKSPKKWEKMDPRTVINSSIHLILFVQRCSYFKI